MKTIPQKGNALLLQIALFTYAATILYPFLWMAINAFKSNPEFYANVWSWPEKLLWSNYAKAWQESGLGTYFFNSLFITAGGTFLAVMFSAMSSYTVAKYKFTGRGAIFFFAVSSFLIPQIGSLAALYKLMIDLHLFNSHIGLLILYSGGLSMNFIILYGFYRGISWEYAEAAFIDGASHWQIFFRIMLPLSGPSIAAVSLVTMVSIWNDYFLPFMFLQDAKLYTISVGLYDMTVKQQYAANWTTLFAALTLSVIPILLVFILFQNKLVSGFTTGGLKG